MSNIILYENITVPDSYDLDEFNKLYDEYQNGALELRTKLIEHNLRLVFKVVIKYFNNSPLDKNDLVQYGCIGLIRAFDTYDKSKNVEFSTYAVKCIYTTILISIRRKKSEQKTKICSLDEDIYLDDSKNITIKDQISDDYDFTMDYIKNQEFNYIDSALIYLDDIEREIIKLYFGFYDKRYKQNEIASKYNISQAHVSRIINKALKKLKDIYFELEKDKNANVYSITL